MNFVLAEFLLRLESDVDYLNLFVEADPDAKTLMMEDAGLGPDQIDAVWSVLSKGMPAESELQKQVALESGTTLTDIACGKIRTYVFGLVHRHPKHSKE